MGWISVSALADALIARLNPTLPPDCRLERGTVEGWGGVWFFLHTGEGSWGGTGFANLEETIDEAVVPIVVEQLLDTLQDDVAHATYGLAWPERASGPEPLLEPWVKVADGVLSLGYGHLTLADDVRLADLRADG